MGARNANLAGTQLADEEGCYLRKLTIPEASEILNLPKTEIWKLI